MAYTENKVTLKYLTDAIGPEVVEVAKEYFKKNPNKTVFKVDSKFRIRKHEETNMFSVYMR